MRRTAHEGALGGGGGSPSHPQSPHESPEMPGASPGACREPRDLPTLPPTPPETPGATPRAARAPRSSSRHCWRPLEPPLTLPETPLVLLDNSRGSPSHPWCHQSLPEPPRGTLEPPQAAEPHHHKPWHHNDVPTTTAVSHHRLWTSVTPARGAPGWQRHCVLLCFVLFFTIN